MKGMSDKVGDEVLVRRLHGQLRPDEARALDERLENDAALAARYRRLEALWGSLELPPTAEAPRGFSAQVAARAQGASLWALAPNWVRGGAAAALVVGLTLGVGVGERLFTNDSAPSAGPIVAERSTVPEIPVPPVATEVGSVEPSDFTTPTSPEVEPSETEVASDAVVDALDPSEVELGEGWFGGESFADRYWMAIGTAIEGEDESSSDAAESVSTVEGSTEEMP